MTEPERLLNKRLRTTGRHIAWRVVVEPMHTTRLGDQFTIHDGKSLVVDKQGRVHPDNWDCAICHAEIE